MYGSINLKKSLYFSNSQCFRLKTDLKYVKYSKLQKQEKEEITPNISIEEFSTPKPKQNLELDTTTDDKTLSPPPVSPPCTPTCEESFLIGFFDVELESKKRIDNTTTNARKKLFNIPLEISTPVEASKPKQEENTNSLRKTQELSEELSDEMFDDFINEEPLPANYFLFRSQSLNNNIDESLFSSLKDSLNEKFDDVGELSLESKLTGKKRAAPLIAEQSSPSTSEPVRKKRKIEKSHTISEDSGFQWNNGGTQRFGKRNNFVRLHLKSKNGRGRGGKFRGRGRY